MPSPTTSGGDQPEIIKLNPDKYEGFRLEFTYQTKAYYDIIRKEDEFFSIQFITKEFDCEQSKSFDGHLFADHLEAPSAFGLSLRGSIIGYLEVDREAWHQRLRVTELLILDDYRRLGYGKLLLDKAKEIALSEGFREMVLETQTCNTCAIDFYLEQGFFVNGIDLSHYTNTDVEKHEVRIEMVYRCEGISNGIN